MLCVHACATSMLCLLPSVDAYLISYHHEALIKIIPIFVRTEQYRKLVGQRNFQF